MDDDYIEFPEWLSSRANSELKLGEPIFPAVNTRLCISKANFQPPSPQDDRRLVASCDGPIQELLLTIPDFVKASWHNRHLPWWGVAKILDKLFRALPAQVQLYVMTHQSFVADLQVWLEEVGKAGQSTIVPVPNEVNFTIWAQDSYAITAAADKRYLVEPFYMKRNADRVLADIFCEATDRFDDTQVPVFFEGGNMLVGDSFVLVGADYANKTVSYFTKDVLRRDGIKPDVDYVTELFGKYLDHHRDFIFVAANRSVPIEENKPFDRNGVKWTAEHLRGNVKNTVQPLFHIDMFITLVGRPAEGAPFQILVGDTGIATEHYGFAPTPVGIDEALDDIAENLALVGDFKVMRIPLPYIFRDIEAEKIRKWYFATYNNAIVQNCRHRPQDGESLVILPSYGDKHSDDEELRRLAAIDDDVARLWSDLGFTTTLIPRLQSFASAQGALHCVTKYLSRG